MRGPHAQKASRSGSPPGSVANKSMLANRVNASATVSRWGSANASAVRPRNVKVFFPAVSAASFRIAAQSVIKVS